MKPRALAFLLMLVFAGRMLGAEVGLDFAGVMGKGKEVRVALTNKATGTTQWVAVGGNYAGYTLTSYDPKTDVVIVSKDGQQFRLGLKQGKVAKADAKAPPALEKAVLNNLRQLAAAADQFYLENGKTMTTYDDLVGPTKYVKAITAVDGENYRALQFVQGRTFVVTTQTGYTFTYAP